jgi:hypothetical protein
LRIIGRQVDGERQAHGGDRESGQRVAEEPGRLDPIAGRVGGCHDCACLLRRAKWRRSTSPFPVHYGRTLFPRKGLDTGELSGLRLALRREHATVNRASSHWRGAPLGAMTTAPTEWFATIPETRTGRTTSPRMV